MYYLNIALEVVSCEKMVIIEEVVHKINDVVSIHPRSWQILHFCNGLDATLAFNGEVYKHSSFNRSFQNIMAYIASSEQPACSAPCHSSDFAKASISIKILASLATLFGHVCLSAVFLLHVFTGHFYRINSLEQYFAIQAALLNLFCVIDLSLGSTIVPPFLVVTSS